MFTLPFKVKLARTLWANAYRAQIKNNDGDYVATLRLLPQIPLDRLQVPETAPEVKLYLIIFVEDAPLLAETNLHQFEDNISTAVLEALEQQAMYPDTCQFVYPNLTDNLQPITQH